MTTARGRSRGGPIGLAVAVVLGLTAAWPRPSVAATGAARKPGARRVTLGPPPAWVTLPPPDDRGGQASPAPTADRPALETLLYDEQIRLEPGKVQRFLHIEQQVHDEEGLEEAAGLTVPYDPSWHTVVLHVAEVRRGGVVVTRLHPDHIEDTRREKRPAEAPYDPYRLVNVTLPDVRPGDVVAYAWTVVSTDPVKTGRPAGTVGLVGSYPTRRERLRILAVGALPVRIGVHGGAPAPTERRTKAGTEYLWELRDVAPLLDEEAAPPEADDGPWVQFTTWESWRDFVAWARPRFAAAPTAAVEAEAARLRREHADPAAAVLAAVRFVQRDVRTIDAEMGLGDLVAGSVDETLARRAGDVHDKVTLLVALLRALGVEADVALVHGGLRGAVRDLLPGSIFGHALVRFTLGERTHWVYVTRTHQGGGLEALVPPRFGAALVLAAGQDGPIELPVTVPAAPTTVVEERWRLVGRMAALEVTTRYEGADADLMRKRLADEPRDDLARKYREFYESHHGGVTTARPLVVEDDVAANRITLRERYVVTRVDEDEGFYAATIADTLVAPKGDPATRKLPVDVDHPSFVRHTTIVELGEPASRTPHAVEHADGHIRYRFEASGRDDTLTMTHTFQTLTAAVPAAAFADYLALVETIRGELVRELIDTPIEAATSEEWWLSPRYRLLLFLVVAAYAAWNRLGKA